MATEGIEGFVVETRNYGATAAFWASLGFENTFESEDGSGQWAHPGGGPYVLIVERHDVEPQLYPVVRVADAAESAPGRDLEFVQPFTAQHWGVLQALVRDPDGRTLSSHAAIDRLDATASRQRRQRAARRHSQVRSHHKREGGSRVARFRK